MKISEMTTKNIIKIIKLDAGASEKVDTAERANFIFVRSVRLSLQHVRIWCSFKNEFFLSNARIVCIVCRFSFAVFENCSLEKSLAASHFLRHSGARASPTSSLRKTKR